MRVLIITHERSGGNNLLYWLAEELGSQQTMHEPLKHQGSEEAEDWKTILNHPHLIVKTRFFMMEKKELVESLPLSFPFVVCLTRNDTRAAAVSYVHTQELGHSHTPYENSPKWEKDNAEEIEKHKERFDEESRSIRKLPYLQITYEGIYGRDPVQLSALLNYLNISNPKHIEKYLDPSRRLRQKSKKDKTYMNSNATLGQTTTSIFHKITTGLLSEKSSFSGEILTEEEIRIDGKFKGKIESKDTVVVWINGEVEGDIICKNADILGKVTGTIEASGLLLLRQNCQVDGHLKGAKIQMEPGSSFNGQCEMITSNTSKDI